MLPEELRGEFTEMGTYELGFEGCIEVHHQVERYNPDKGNSSLGEWEEKMHKYDTFNIFGKQQSICCD